MRKTWLITGSSRGFGWELAQAVLDSGDTVLATARRPDQLDELVRKHGDRVRTSRLMSRTPRPPGPQSRRRSTSSARSTSW